MSFPASRLATVSRAALTFSGSMPSNALSWLVRASMSLRRPADSALTAEILFTRSGTLYAISAPSSATHTGKPSFTTTWPFSSSLSFMVSFSVRVRASRRGIPWHHATIGGQGRIIGHEYRPAAGMCRKGLLECFLRGGERLGSGGSSCQPLHREWRDRPVLRLEPCGKFFPLSGITGLLKKRLTIII